MPIKEISKNTLGKSKSGWRWDAKQRCFVTWQLDTTYKGKRYRKRGFRTKGEAQSHWDDLKLSERAESLGLVKKKVAYPSVKSLFDLRLKDIEKRNEYVRAKRVFATFLSIVGPEIKIDKIARKHFKDFADLRLQELTEKQKVSHGVVNETRAKKTVNREINPIAKAFSSADHYFALKKWIQPKVFKFNVSREGRKRILEPEEYKALLRFFLTDRKSREKLKDYRARRRTGLIFQMMLMSGLRHGEVVAMEKGKLNRRKREIDVFRFKGNRWKLFAPLTNTHMWLFDQGNEIYPESKFFFSAQGKIHNKTYSIVKAACKEIGISYGRFQKNGFILHDARHTFSTILHQNLIDNTTAVEFTDNPHAVSDYQHSTEESKVRAMKIIENKFGNGKGSSAKDLKKIFDGVKSGKLNYEEFEDYIKHLLTVF